MIKDNKVGGFALRNSDNTECGTTSSNRRTSYHLVDSVRAWIDRAGETITARSTADNLHAPRRHLVAERSFRFQIDGIPAELDECSSRRVDVGACYVGRPIANRIVTRAPDAGFVCSDSWRIDVEAATRLAQRSPPFPKGRSLSSSATPVRGIRHGKLDPIFDSGGDKHCFVSGKDCLAEGDRTSGIVLSAN